MRAAITMLLLIHGAIHLLGFVKWCHFARVPQLEHAPAVTLSPNGERAFGVLWLVAFLAFAMAAVLRTTSIDAWWMVAAGALALSQALITVAWHDAKFGTLANVLVACAVIAAAAHARFVSHTEAQMRDIVSVTAPASTVRADDLSRLPEPIHRWLTAAGVVGRERAHDVRLEQRGALRTSATGPWLPAHAEQVFDVDDPSFVWRVDAKTMGVLPIAGRDVYAHGKGRMLIEVASLVTIVDASDDKIAAGALLRFLGETVWFPSAALSQTITWEAIDASRARATMRHAGLEATAVFTVDERGRVTQIEAKRWLGGGASAKLEPWVVPCTAWRVMNGVEIPVRGDVVWKLATGDFDYYRWEIVAIETNVAKR